MPFFPISSLNSKKLPSEVSVDSDINYMPPVIFSTLPRSEKRPVVSSPVIRSEAASIIPEGVSNQLGSWGYVKAMEEIANDLTAVGAENFAETTLLSATGFGGTTAGLLLGARLLDLDLDLRAPK